jgi:transcriptional regulator with XRE-family HTH domain
MIRLRYQRFIAGLTQAQLAEKAGIARETVSRIERSERFPTPRVAALLAEAVGMPVEDWMDIAEPVSQRKINFFPPSLRR